MIKVQQTEVSCAHCGAACLDENIRLDRFHFCCTGCKSVYQLINQQGLCDYYSLNQQPGATQRVIVRKDKFAFLDDKGIQEQLISFSNATQCRVVLYLPHIHCSSCLYLLEHLHRLQPGILGARVNFTRKEIEIDYDQQVTTLRKVAELLTQIGYEPYISLAQLKEGKPVLHNQYVRELGVAGFCFANIMLLSFPEYFGLAATEMNLQGIFRMLNLVLALPVVLYSAQPFYLSAWKSLQHGFLHIDGPIVLAIVITFSRSLYEVLSGTGGGYFDSMSGIVFFMLAGKVVQDKTYRRLSFERDYTAYFPIAVTVLKNDQELAVALPGIKPGDTLRIHAEELIPADGILTRGKGLIDYSFVTGESMAMGKEMGEIVYAGGRQKGGAIEVLVTREVAQSYLTRLWNQDALRQKKRKEEASFVHVISQYFTYMVLGIAGFTALYWWVYDASKIANAVTAILIVACPCALLLAGTFTNGNILRILGRNGLYLRDAQAIEDIGKANHIVFDKTGTLTSVQEMEVKYEGGALSQRELEMVAALAGQSGHPLTRALYNWLPKDGGLQVTDFREIAGEGIAGLVKGVLIQLGNAGFVKTSTGEGPIGTRVYINWQYKEKGCFVFGHHYRKDIPQLLNKLGKDYALSMVSGDNNRDEQYLHGLLGSRGAILFNQHPQDKLRFVEELQEGGERVLMIGDGLNDAGALRQSNAGIALAEDTNNFTPASDGILEAGQLSKLGRFIKLCKANRYIIIGSFCLSILYNLIGLYFAVQGMLSPLVAAILMPASSLSILLVTFGCSRLAGRALNL
jgi:Cu+-exporting ATPase